jgi:hypothetical protein
MNRGNGNGNGKPVALLKWGLVMGNVGSVASEEPLHFKRKNNAQNSKISRYNF